jgi:hypothetical protein
MHNLFTKFKRNVTDTTLKKKLRHMSLQFGLCPTSKDAGATHPYTTQAFKFNLHAQNFLGATGRLLLFCTTLNDANTGVHFDLSSTDPALIVFKPGKAPPYGDTFFELMLLIAPCLPILGPKILAAIDPVIIDALLDEHITV